MVFESLNIFLLPKAELLTNRKSREHDSNRSYLWKEWGQALQRNGGQAYTFHKLIGMELSR